MFVQNVNKKYQVVSTNSISYKSLNDAEMLSPDLAKGETKIWYAKSSRDLIMGYDWCEKKKLSTRY